MSEQWMSLSGGGSHRLGITLFVDDSDVEPSIKRYNKSLQQAEAQTRQFTESANRMAQEHHQYFAGSAETADEWRKATGSAVDQAKNDLLGYVQAVRDTADRWSQTAARVSKDQNQYFSGSAETANEWRRAAGDAMAQIEDDLEGYGVSLNRAGMTSREAMSQQIQMWRAAAESGEKATRSTKKSVRDQVRGLRTLRWELITMMFFFRLFLTVVREVWEGIQAAEEASLRRAGLNALAEMYGKSADSIIASLDRVSQGTLGTRTAVQAAQAGMLADLGQFASSYDSLWQAAEVVNVTVGTDAVSAFGSLTEAISDADAGAVDSVASWIEAEEAVLDYAQSTNQLVDELSDSEVQQVLLQRIQERTNELLDSGAQSAVDQRRAVSDLKGSWTELQDGLGATIRAGEGVNQFLGKVADLLDTITLLSIGGASGFKALTAAMLELITMSPAEAFRMGLEGERIPGITTFDETIRESLRAGLEAIGWYQDEVEATGEVVEEVGETSAQVSERDIELLEERLELYRNMAEAVRQAEREMERALQDMEIERQRTIDDILLDAAREREEIEIDLQRKLEDINRKYERKIEDAEADSRDRRASIERRYRDRLITIEERYIERLRRIQEDYQMSLFDAIGERDATAALQARRQRNLQVRRAGRDRDQERREARRDYERQLADLQDALEQQRRAAARARERAREDAEIARRRAMEDAARAREQEEQDLEIDLERQRQDILLSLERRRDDLWDHYNQELYMMDQQHQQQVIREQAFQRDDLAMYQQYLQTRLQYYQNYISSMGFSATSPGDPFSGPYDMYGGYSPPGGSMFQEGGAFVARGRQTITVGEGSQAELVQIQPLRQMTGPVQVSEVRGRIDHEVRGMVQAQMANMSGQLTAVVSQAVLQALAGILT